MIWQELDDDVVEPQQREHEEEEEGGGGGGGGGSRLNFDFFSLISKPKDYYRILEVDYDATEDTIRSNYIRLALKWHPDKKKEEDGATSKFQDINEAYQILSDSDSRREYDKKRMQHVYDYNIIEYLHRYKGLILTCNGLGMKHSIW